MNTAKYELTSNEQAVEFGNADVFGSAELSGNDKVFGSLEGMQALNACSSTIVQLDDSEYLKELIHNEGCVLVEIAGNWWVINRPIFNPFNDTLFPIAPMFRSRVQSYTTTDMFRVVKAQLPGLQVGTYYYSGICIALEAYSI